MATPPRFTRRVCDRCGAAALVEAGALEPYRCDECGAADPGVGGEPGELRVSAHWAANRSNAGMGAAFGALDEAFNPAAARARERVRGDHERQLPKPSPGDDALRTGRIVIRPAEPDPNV